jgi:hypothetical protein
MKFIIKSLYYLFYHIIINLNLYMFIHFLIIIITIIIMDHNDFYIFHIKYS